jgi:hypothetical protein
MSDVIVPESKRRLALDTDWGTALAAVWAFMLCAALGVGTSWTTMRGTFKVSPASWWTPLFAGLLIWMGISIRLKLWRLAAFVAALGPVSRMVLWSLRSPYDARLANEIFVRWIDSVLYFAACVYVVYWFRTKVTRV